MAAFSFVATGEESTRHELRPIFQLAPFTPTQGKNAILYKESRYSLCEYLFRVFALLRIFHGSWGPCSLDIDGLDWFFYNFFLYNSRILLMGLDWLMRRWNQDKGWHFFCHACCWLALCTYIDWLRCIQEKLATSWNLENSQFDSWFFFIFSQNS